MWPVPGADLFRPSLNLSVPGMALQVVCHGYEEYDVAKKMVATTVRKLQRVQVGLIRVTVLCLLCIVVCEAVIFLQVR